MKVITGFAGNSNLPGCKGEIKTDTDQDFDSLQRENQQLKEENVKLLKAVLKLHSEIRKLNMASGKVLEGCECDLWFKRLKERTY